MKLFYLSAHVSVVRDYEKILTELGHTVEGHNLTGHNWTRGREKEGDFGGFNLDRVWAYSENDGEKFYNEFKDKLAGYDAFITCYPPCFARLFTRWGKPIIQVQCVRYDFMLTDNLERWDDYQAWFLKAWKSGQLKLVANNEYDVRYCNAFTDTVPTFIPSLCDYTGVTYAPTLDTALLSDTRVPKLDEAMLKAVPSLRHVRREYGRYKYEQIVQHKAIVHVPYNASVMTFFEHYAMGIPIFVPTPDFLLKLKAEYGALQEIVYNQHIVQSGSLRPPRGMPDPNAHQNYSLLKWWTQYYDHYMTPHINRFDSFEDLNWLISLSQKTLEDLSFQMKIVTAQKRSDVYQKWSKLMEGLG